MTINELIDQIKSICLSHVDVNSWDIGESIDLSSHNSEVPYYSFLEVPFSINSVDKQWEDWSFSLNIFTKPDINFTSEEQIRSCSEAKDICNDIIAKLISENLRISLTYNMLTITQLPPDLLAGVRCELTVRVLKNCRLNKFA